MRLRIAPAALAIVFLIAASTALGEERTWRFRADLDGSPIGYHQFTLSGDDAERVLVTRARFNVKVLGITAYRYEHDATERWRGNCLDRLSAHTDDDGKRLDVSARASDGRMSVSGSQGPHELGPCIMTFAYWNPAILSQTHLLNTQTGEYEAVSVRRIGIESIDAGGGRVDATHYRITGSRHPIDLWYSTRNEWLALESTVDGGRRLRYTASEKRTSE